MKRSSSRRTFLKGGLAGTVSASIPFLSNQATAVVNRRPRYIVMIMASGGLDTVLTFDPKSRAEVEHWVDIPYESSSIVGAEGMSLGPLCGRLAPWSSKLAVLKGVRMGAVNHPAGTWNLLRLRPNSTPEMPTFLEVFARFRDRQPIGTVTFGELFDRFASPEWFVHTSMFSRIYEARPQGFEPFERMDPARRLRLARAMSVHARRLQEEASPRARATARSYRDVAAYLRASVEAPPFESSEWAGVSPENATRERAVESFQRTLWLFENDLAAASYIQVTQNSWDTHIDNLAEQTQHTEFLTALLDHLFRELENRRNSHGSLAENTLVIVSSELGRFPRLNSHGGKDHFPEMPMMFFGSGINTNDGRGAVFGGTGRQMEALPVDTETGQPTRRAGGQYVRVEDVGTTLLEMCGIPPNPFGYHGNALRFLIT